MRAKTTKIHHKKRRKILKLAKGYRQARHRLYRVAKTVVMHAGQHAYNSRKQKKRNFRSLWIMRINAASRNHGLSYSQLVDLLKKSNIKLNRRSLANIAFLYPQVFDKIVLKVKK
ncbi:MAG: 50S ribosomal protein L20 [Leptospiraceae bacterium]|nr:50S ribosomal protein L20 [Leptospiraceae bacterium]MDW7975927.1 50S ribosomal protein L20 [Leptospiraceae bacterium]